MLVQRMVEVRRNKRKRVSKASNRKREGNEMLGKMIKRPCIQNASKLNMQWCDDVERLGVNDNIERGDGRQMKEVIELNGEK